MGHLRHDAASKYPTYAQTYAAAPTMPTPVVPAGTMAPAAGVGIVAPRRGRIEVPDVRAAGRAAPTMPIVPAGTMAPPRRRTWHLTWYDVGDVYPTSVQVRDADGAAADATAVVHGRRTRRHHDHTADRDTARRPRAGHPHHHARPVVGGLERDRAQRIGLLRPVHRTRPGVRARPVLADAKAYLNITSTDSDDELRTYLDVVTQKGEDFLRPRVRASHHRRGPPRSRWQRSLLLPIGPVLALAAVSGDGDAIDPAAVTTIRTRRCCTAKPAGTTTASR